MPCQSGPMYDERTDWKVYKQELDALTAEADLLREAVIAYAEGKSPDLPPELLRKIKTRQTAHRKEDLARLEAVFVAAKDKDRLALVWAADPKKPLEPQLGFDPDAF